MIDITGKQWKKFMAFIKLGLGVSVTPEQEAILHERLGKLGKKYAVDTYEELFHMLVDNPAEGVWEEFVEGIVFRPSHFFKENYYLEYLVEHMAVILEENKRIRQSGELRIWSLGCSTGEEPFALAIVLQECLPPTIRVKILASDIHTGALITASNGSFGPEIKADVSPYLLDKYFKTVPEGYKLKPEIKRLVTFRLINPLHRYSFRNDFDIIFCQNSLAYYDNLTRRQLFEKFYQKLHNGGLLLAGHSRDLPLMEGYFRRLEPTIYLR